MGGLAASQQIYDLSPKKIDEYAYEFTKKREYPKWAYITSIQSIGLPDITFASEKVMEKKKTKKLTEDQPKKIYADEKFNPNVCPLVTYLPTNRVLIKLMRACIMVNSP